MIYIEDDVPLRCRTRIGLINLKTSLLEALNKRVNLQANNIVPRCV